MTRVVVFGASGFIGAAVASALAKCSDLELVPVSHRRLKGYLTADLTSPESLRAVLAPGDIVVNCAGYANATDATVAGRRRFQAVNVDGVAALAEACVARGACQLIHLSSVAAMGAWAGQDIDEEMQRRPATPYAISKLQSERVLERFRDRLFVTILRPTSIFGEGRGLAHGLCRLASWPLVPLPAAGRAMIPFCYVGNLVEGIKLTLGNTSCHGQVFIIGDDRSYMLREIVQAFAHALEKRPLLLPIPAAASEAAAVLAERYAVRRNSIPVIDRQRINSLTRSVSYSITRFRAATGYRPIHDLQTAAGRIADWYRQGARR
jgi:nucleoside-diphosphate-sugar epimerase